MSRAGESTSQGSFEPKNVLFPVPIPEVKRLSELTGKPASYWQNPMHYKESDYNGIDDVAIDGESTLKVHVNGNSIVVVTEGNFTTYSVVGQEIATGKGVSTLDDLSSGLYIAVNGHMAVKFAIK